MYTPGIRIKEDFRYNIQEILLQLNHQDIINNWKYNDKTDTLLSPCLIFNNTEMIKVTGNILYDLLHNGLEFNFYIELNHPKGQAKTTWHNYKCATELFNNIQQNNNYKYNIIYEITEDFSRALLYVLDQTNRLYENYISLNLYSKENY